MKGAKIRITVSEKALKELETIAQKKGYKTNAECCRKILEEMIK